jgi:hypothetical protein
MLQLSKAVAGMNFSLKINDDLETGYELYSNALLSHRPESASLHVLGEHHENIGYLGRCLTIVQWLLHFRAPLGGVIAVFVVS